MCWLRDAAFSPLVRTGLEKLISGMNGEFNGVLWSEVGLCNVGSAAAVNKITKNNQKSASF